MFIFLKKHLFDSISTAVFDAKYLSVSLANNFIVK